MPMIDEAIKHYHELLQSSRAEDAQARLATGTDRYNLKFGSRPICSVLRPFLITSHDYNQVMLGSRLVVRAVRKLGAALLVNAVLRSKIDISPDEERLIAIEPGYTTADASGRLDAFLGSHGGFHFVEYNAESPGGLLYGDCLSEIFLGMDVVRDFSQKYPVWRVPIRPRILQALLACYREWGGIDNPQIGIVDWNEVSTRAEFEISREYFESQGHRTAIIDPGELEIREGRLWAGDFRVDLVYKRVVTGELLERGGFDHPLIRAAAEHLACVVNSFRVQMLFKKALFALLDDPEVEHLFEPEEIRAIRDHIPWTRRLEEGFAMYHGRRLDLLEFVAANRERLVLKPNSDYGGRGVSLGWECSNELWQEKMRDALGASFVVQERVEVREESFPRLVDGQIQIAKYYVDFDPYTWVDNDVTGAGVRLSSSALLNVTSGGGSATPLLIIDKS
ncbi:MAG: hypothetical protein ABI882_05655 [Acidobacteriota bacterium]